METFMPITCEQLVFAGLYGENALRLPKELPDWTKDELFIVDSGRTED